MREPIVSDDAQAVPALLDREIGSSQKDAFGHRHFATMLQGLIESEEIEPPFSIGLLGNWGSGKSSIKSMYETSLADDASKSPKSQRFRPITFNAWRFGGEHLKRALLRHVYLELGGDKTKLDDALFRQIQDTVDVKKSLRDVMTQFFDGFGINLIVLMALYVFVLLAVILMISIVGIEHDIATALLTGGALFAPLPALKWLLESSRVSRFASTTRVQAPSSTAEEYEDLLIDQLREFKKQGGKHCERIVIFVDDLDRLSSEEMIDGLDAIRTFMEIPKVSLPRGLGIIFVISCDEDRLADALVRRRNGTLDLESGYQNDARRYLDRIFQFRIDIPPFPKQDMRAYAQAQLQATLPTLKDELGALELTLEALVDRMIHVQVQTPRNTIQILNTFIQAWWIAKQKEKDGTGSNRPGGLQDGSVTKYPIALGAICTLRVDFADFFTDLQQEAKLIEHFTDVFMRDAALKDKPTQVIPILQQYVQPNTLDTLDPRFRPLRQFIASLQDVRWPPSMEPLLILSQDPVTRQFGDGRRALYEAFVSGDKQGVLTELGRQNDTKALSVDHMRIMKSMVEELGRETDIRQNNAAFVLAELAARYSDETADILLTPLAYRLSQSPELRWRIGVTNIGEVIQRAKSDDKVDVACRLIEDFMTTSEETVFRLTSGEAPSLGELAAMCEAACNIVLGVCDDAALPEASEKAILSWLLDRSFRTEQKEDSLPFQTLERWTQDHESWLLPAMGETYTKAVIEQLEGELDIESPHDCIRQMNEVFTQMQATGEMSRATLWSQLIRLVRVKSRAFVTFSTQFAESTLQEMDKTNQDMDETTLGRFLQAYSSRLTMYEIERTIEDGVGVRFIQLIAAQGFTEIEVGEEDEDTPSLAILQKDLLTRWSTEEVTAELAADLMSACYGKTDVDAVFHQWCQTLLTTLPQACTNWLAENFDQLIVAHQDYLTGQLQAVYTDDNLDKELAERYGKFIRSLSDASRTSEAMKEHAKQLFNHIEQRHANPNNYLFRVFIVIPKLMASVDPAVRGTTLQVVFANTKNNPELFGWLCHVMAHHWPTSADNMGSYQPQNIFNDANSIVTENPALQWSYGCVETMYHMVKRNVIDSSHVQTVSTAACLIWPHNGDTAIKAIEAMGAPPETKTLVELLLETGTENREPLEALLTLIVEGAEAPYFADIAFEILERPPHGTDDEPDLGLTAWIAALDRLRPDTLITIFERDDLNDEQRKRVWLQVERHASHFDGAFYLEVLPLILSLESEEATNEVFGFAQKMSEGFEDQDQRYELGTVLMRIFEQSASLEVKKRLGKWLGDLKINSVLNELADPTQDQIDLLGEHFPRSDRSFRKLKDRVKRLD